MKTFHSSGLLFLLLIITLPGIAQVKISGKVIAPGGNPLSLVSVMVLRDSTLVKGAVTKEDGHFTLELAPQAGKLTLRLSRIGYQSLSATFTYSSPPAVASYTMQPVDKTLNEVVVSSKKPLITRKADRYIVNVEDSYLANANSALEVLSKSPGVWVTPNGMIRLTGSQPVTVMINNVVQRMQGNELAEYLRTLRSEDISKIEIIPNPPAEFEASATGGIIHIILKRSRREGLSGTLYAQYRQQGRDPYASEGGSIDLKLPKTYLFGSVSYTNDKSRYNGYTNVLYPDNSKLLNETDRFNNNQRWQFRGGASWDLTPHQSLTAQVTGAGNRLAQQFISTLDYDMPANDVTGNANSAWLRTPWQGSGTVNYEWRIDSAGSSLKLLADYTRAGKHEENELLSVYSETARNSHLNTNTPSTTDIGTLQADYTKALAKNAAFRGGIKYVSTERNNTVLTQRNAGAGWIKDSAGSNVFRYNERLLMAYGSWEKTKGSNSIRVGLRGEMTWSAGHSLTSNESIEKNYFSLFPSVFLNHVFNEKKGNSFNFSYSRRVRRPGFNDLNPYRLQVHDFTILTGNPTLIPQYTHSFSAGYVFHQQYTVTAYFQSTHNFIASTAHTVDSNIIEYQSRNFRNNTEYGLSFNGLFTIGKIWNIRPGFFISHAHADLDSVTINQLYYNAQVSQDISIKKWFDADVTVWYNSAYYVDATAKQVPVLSTNIGITRKIFKGNVRLRFFANDLFNNEKEKQVTQYAHTRIDFYQKRPTRSAGIALNWNFKAGKIFTRKKIDANNSDEKSRL